LPSEADGTRTRNHRIDSQSLPVSKPGDRHYLRIPTEDGDTNGEVPMSVPLCPQLSAVNDWLEQCPVDLAPVFKAGIAAMIQAINV